MITIKLFHPASGTTRRLTYSAPDIVKWVGLALQVEALFHISVQNAALKYVDSDGDEVVLNSDAELDEVIRSNPFQQPGDAKSDIWRFTVIDLSELRSAAESETGGEPQDGGDEWHFLYEPNVAAAPENMTPPHIELLPSDTASVLVSLDSDPTDIPHIAAAEPPIPESESSRTSTPVPTFTTEEKGKGRALVVSPSPVPSMQYHFDRSRTPSPSPPPRPIDEPYSPLSEIEDITAGIDGIEIGGKDENGHHPASQWTHFGDPNAPMCIPPVPSDGTCLIPSPARSARLLTPPVPTPVVQPPTNPEPSASGTLAPPNILDDVSNFIGLLTNAFESHPELSEGWKNIVNKVGGAVDGEISGAVKEVLNVVDTVVKAVGEMSARPTPAHQPLEVTGTPVVANLSAPLDLDITPPTAATAGATATGTPEHAQGPPDSAREDGSIVTNPFMSVPVRAPLPPGFFPSSVSFASVPVPAGFIPHPPPPPPPPPHPFYFPPSRSPSNSPHSHNWLHRRNTHGHAPAHAHPHTHVHHRHVHGHGFIPMPPPPMRTPSSPPAMPPHSGPHGPPPPRPHGIPPPPPGLIGALGDGYIPWYHQTIPIPHRTRTESERKDNFKTENESDRESATEDEIEPPVAVIPRSKVYKPETNDEDDDKTEKGDADAYTLAFKAHQRARESRDRLETAKNKYKLEKERFRADKEQWKRDKEALEKEMSEKMKKHSLAIHASASGSTTSSRLSSKKRATMPAGPLANPPRPRIVEAPESPTILTPRASASAYAAPPLPPPPPVTSAPAPTPEAVARLREEEEARQLEREEIRARLRGAYGSNESAYEENPSRRQFGGGRPGPGPGPFGYSPYHRRLMESGPNTQYNRWSYAGEPGAPTWFDDYSRLPRTIRNVSGPAPPPPAPSVVPPPPPIPPPPVVPSPAVGGNMEPNSARSALQRLIDDSFPEDPRPEEVMSQVNRSSNISLASLPSVASVIRDTDVDAPSPTLAPIVPPPPSVPVQVRPPSPGPIRLAPIRIREEGPAPSLIPGMFGSSFGALNSWTAAPAPAPASAPPRDRDLPAIPDGASTSSRATENRTMIGRILSRLNDMGFNDESRPGGLRPFVTRHIRMSFMSSRTMLQGSGALTEQEREDEIVNNVLDELVSGGATPVRQRSRAGSVDRMDAPANNDGNNNNNNNAGDAWERDLLTRSGIGSLRGFGPGRGRARGLGFFQAGSRMPGGWGAGPWAANGGPGGV